MVLKKIALCFNLFMLKDYSSIAFLASMSTSSKAVEDISEVKPEARIPNQPKLRVTRRQNSPFSEKSPDIEVGRLLNGKKLIFRISPDIFEAFQFSEIKHTHYFLKTLCLKYILLVLFLKIFS